MAQRPLRLLSLQRAVARIEPDPLHTAGCQVKPVVLGTKVLEVEVDRLGELIGRQSNPPASVDPVKSMLNAGRMSSMLAAQRKVEGFRENRSLTVDQSCDGHIM